MMRNRSSIVSLFNSIAVMLMTLSLTICTIGILYVQHDYFNATVLLIGLSILAIIMLLLFSLSAFPDSDHHAFLLILFTSFALLFSWNYFFDAQPMSDYAVLWEGAQQILDGSFYQRSADPSDYFSFYNFQIGYAYYLSLLAKLFSNSLTTMKLAQIVVITLTNLVIYKTLRLYFSITKSLFSTLFFIFFPYIFLGSGILNNQHESLFFISLAVYIYLSSDKYLRYFLCASMLSLGNMLRPTCTVVLCALALASIIHGITEKSRKSLIGAFIQLLTFFLLSALINYSFILSGLAPKGIKVDNLWFKLILGLTGTGITGHPTTDAIHTNLYYDLLYYSFDYPSYQRAAQTHLITLIKTNSLDYRWIGNSFLRFIGSIDNQVYYGNSDFVSDHPLFIYILNAVGSGIFTLSILSSLFITLAHRKITHNPLLTVSALIFGGYFVIYLFLEKQPRYRYEQYYALFLFGIPLIADILQKTTQRIKYKLFPERI